MYFRRLYIGIMIDGIPPFQRYPIINQSTVGYKILSTQLEKWFDLRTNVEGPLSIVHCPSPKNTESSQYTANFRQKHKKFAVYCKLFSHLSIAETIATKLLQQEIGSTNHFNTTVVDHQSHLIHRNNIFGIIIFYFLQIAKLPFVSIVVGWAGYGEPFRLTGQSLVDCEASIEARVFR